MNDFSTLFGSSPTIAAEAPGRVNLIGEHTDYNGGFVLPTAIPQRTLVELSPRNGQLVRVGSDAAPESAPQSFTLGTESRGRGWLDYVQGVTALLSHECKAITGFDARVTSTVPLGSGLSSSASLTVALFRALRIAFQFPLDDLQLALFAQRVENEFVGARVGIMDPMAVSLADERTAIFLDARSHTYERVPLPPTAELVVIHSGVAHDHAAGDYNTRRSECEEACRLLGVSQLRDLSVGPENPSPPKRERGELQCPSISARGELAARLAALPPPLDRRVRHVVSENERVIAAVQAMRAGDLATLGRLFYASHDSMRHDYEVSVPEIDLLVDLARTDKDVFGARLTGGGFGGSVVLLVHAGTGRKVAERITTAYQERSGRQPRIIVPLVSRQ
jgi:galactokinase